jgi:hypothetical protein
MERSGYICGESSYGRACWLWESVSSKTWETGWVKITTTQIMFRVERNCDLIAFYWLMRSGHTPYTILCVSKTKEHGPEIIGTRVILSLICR